jgi:hypothetical protein
MALGIDDVVEAVATPVVLVGLGVLVAAPVALVVSRPVAKRMIRTFLDASDKVRESAAETREKWSDLVAEVKAERAAEAAARVESAAEPEATG